MEDILLSGAMGAGGAALGKVAGPTVNRLFGGTPSKTTGLDNLYEDLGKAETFFDQAVSGQFEKAFDPTTKAFESLLDDPFALRPATSQVSVPSPAQPVPAPAGDSSGMLYDAARAGQAQNVLTYTDPISGLTQKIAVAPQRPAPIRTVVDNQTGDSSFFKDVTDFFSGEPELVQDAGRGKEVFDTAFQGQTLMAMCNL